MDDTIFAVASGAPPAAIAIIRISGPMAATCATVLAGRCPAPRRATLRRLHNPGTGIALDDALLLWFPGPASATGEDCLELHLHGGRAVQAAVLAALAAIAGCRVAQPGEFTRRAHANGRIDILQAEGLADLLSAETEDQRRTALALSEGALSREVADWQHRLLDLSAELEMAIDYAEDDQADAIVMPQLRDAVSTLAADWRARLAGPSSEAVRDGFSVVLCGPPNAGKSSLLNRLVGYDAAIVTDIAGTTRDRIDVRVVRAGRVFRLTDTAGLRGEGADRVEAIGIARADAAIAAADLRLWMGDDPPRTPAPTLWLWARCDQIGREGGPRNALAVSSETEAGIAALWERIAALEDETWGRSAGLNARHLNALTDAFLALNAPANDATLLAENLRAARAALGRLAGTGGTEDLLDHIFGRFCLGK